MKIFKIIMKAISKKEIYLTGKNEDEAFKKLEKMYFKDGTISFTDDDVLEVDNTCEELVKENKISKEYNEIVCEKCGNCIVVDKDLLS